MTSWVAVLWRYLNKACGHAWSFRNVLTCAWITFTEDSEDRLALYYNNCLERLFLVILAFCAKSAFQKWQRLRLSSWWGVRCRGHLSCDSDVENFLLISFCVTKASRLKNHFSISRKSPSWNGSWFWDEMDENETINQAEQASLFVEAGYNNDVFEILSETCPRLNAWPCFAKNSAFIGLVGFDLFFVRRNMIVLLLLFRWTSRFNYLSVVRSRFSHVLVDFLFVMQVILWNKNVQPIYFLVNLIFRDNY